MRIVPCCALLALCACADLEADPDGRTRLDRPVHRDLRPYDPRGSWAENARAEPTDPGAPPDPGDPPGPPDPGDPPDPCDPPDPPDPGPPLAEEAFLKPVKDNLVMEFGAPIAVDGDTMVAGAPWSDFSYDTDGEAFVFVRDGDGWSQQAYLHHPPDETGDGFLFGRSLAVQGDLLAVGVPRQGNGVVHIFERTGTEWTRTAVLEPPYQPSHYRAEFGHKVALDGDRLAVAMPGDSSDATGVGGDPANEDAPYSGAVHVYVRDGAGWSPEAYIKGTRAIPDDYFGYSLALSGDALAAGSFDDSSATGVNGDQDNADSPLSGAVFVFRRGADGWAQEAYVKASNTGAGDRFGVSTRPANAVTLSGDRLVVGAVGEDSAATGLDGDQASNDAEDAGAVYVFTRVLGTWSQEAYVKASNPGAGDSFGHHVALAGDRLAVSAPREDSDADGVDGDQGNDLAPEAGAAYLFERGAGWAQRHYLKASNSAASDSFGWGLAWDGLTLVAGAPGQYTCPDPDPTDLCLRIGAAYVFR